MKRYLELISDREESINLNTENIIRLIIIELIGNTIFDINSTKKEIIEKIDIVLGEKQNKGIRLLLKNKIKYYKEKKRKEFDLLGIDFDTYIKSKLIESPETFIKSIITEIGLDFYEIENNGINKLNSIKDIPIQARETSVSGVEQEFNGTVGILKNSNGDIVSNQRIIDILLSKELINKDNINNILNYLSGPGSEVFRKTIELLIQEEEDFYGWGKLKGKSTKAFFIPGGGGGLTIARDFFIEEGELVCVPNYRWPNIDGIITSKTKIPPATIDLILEDGSINFESIDNAIKNSIELSRRKITFYFNFPANPTGTTISKSDGIKINDIFEKYEENIDIQIILDDPYGAFNIESDGSVRKPLSYYINTNKNIIVIEIGSHGTKEAGIYGLRAGILRVISNNDKVNIIEDKLNKAIRETFSMSPSLPQMILIKAILGEKVDAFNLKGSNTNQEYIDNLNEEEIKYRIKKYLESRIDMFNIIKPKIDKIKEEILSQCGEYLIPMENIQEGKKYTGGFMVCFSLTDKAKELGLDLEKLRKICNRNGKNGIGFTTFLDNLNNEVVIRITLFSGDEKIYAKRLKNYIIETVT